MRNLRLPEPAGSLHARTRDLLDAWLPEVMPPDGVWAIGGGTMLAARWKHRKSMDLDIALPSQSGLSALSPAWNREFTDGMAALGATGVQVQTQALKFKFESPRALLAGLVKMGLEPWVVAQYGTVARFLQAAGPEFEARGRSHRD